MCVLGQGMVCTRTSVLCELALLFLQATVGPTLWPEKKALPSTPEYSSFNWVCRLWFPGSGPQSWFTGSGLQAFIPGLSSPALLQFSVVSKSTYSMTVVWLTDCRPTFLPGYYIVVYLADCFLHLINARQQDLPCYSLFLSGEAKSFVVYFMVHVSLFLFHIEWGCTALMERTHVKLNRVSVGT